ncbi:protein phosphatase 2C domain-containing protein [Lacticaseibacillus hulanensis]|uniref:protein phosphatase 2C domain-containing protein n=1 Tax=Lacticaseibacillus hulanensis TaxID=2493111 RepID=UPI000FD96E4B|nr:protein phosphatase 2C domain-containing protein [Lacticaseibacillus hulanensis]
MPSDNSKLSIIKDTYLMFNKLKIFLEVVQMSIRYRVIISTTTVAVLVTFVYSLFDFAQVSSPTLSSMLQHIAKSALTHVIPTILIMMIVLITSAIVMYEYKRHTFGFSKLSINEQKLIQERLTLDDSLKSAGYKIESFNHDDQVELYITSQKVNQHLRDRNRPIFLIGSALEYSIPNDMLDYVPALLRRKIINDKIVFNGRILGLVDEIYPETSTLHTREVRYFETQVTDEIIYYSLRDRRDLKQIKMGIDLFTNGSDYTHRELIPLTHNAQTNYMGVSTLLLTSDNHVVLQVQGKKSNINADNYAPSGSGSVEYKDWQVFKKNQPTLNQVLVHAVERELVEELGLAHWENKNKLNLQTQLIGYARLFERGGKPDFFLVTRTSMTIAELNDTLKDNSHNDLAEWDLSDGSKDAPEFNSLTDLRSILSLDYARRHGHGQSVQNVIFANILQPDDLQLTHASITDRGNTVNEDFVYTTDSYGFVIDGASNLTSRVYKAGNSDAQLFSHTVGQYLKKANWQEYSIQQLLSMAVADFNAQYPSTLIDKERLPSATFSAFRVHEDRIELTWLGDSPIIVLSNNNEYEVHRDPTIEQNDKKAISNLAELISEQKPIEEALEDIQPILKANRLLKNSTEKGGYWILDPTGVGINHLHQESIPLADVIAILICSDGFYRVFDTFRYRLQIPQATNVHEWLTSSMKDLRAMENKERSMNNYPRFKVSDDASALINYFPKSEN